MISTSNIEEAKRLIKKESKPIIVLAQNDDFNRKILEYGKFDIILDIESGNRKDKPKQLDSGLNHVIANIAAKNKVAIGIDLAELKKLDKKNKAIRIARIKQNIALCKKSGTKIAILNYKDKRNAISFLLSLGASTPQASKSLDF